MRSFGLLALAAVVSIQQPLIDGILPTLVEIRATTPKGISTGAGFIVEASGIAVTCFHVLEGSSQVAVRLPSGEVFADVRVLGFDRQRDIALVKFAGYGLPVLPLGDSDATRVGQDVWAFGHPSGLKDTVSKGIVSAVRTIDGHKVIQTDTPASPGNSGGPLTDRDGKCIGVVSFKWSGESLNFAVPVNYVKGLLGMQTPPMTLQEFNEASSKGTEALFGSVGKGLTGRWLSLESSRVQALREEGDYVYGLTDGVPQDEAATYDMKRSADGSIAGRVKYRFRCRYYCEWECFVSKWIENACTMDGEIKLTKIDKNRIEGYTRSPGVPKPSDRIFGMFCKSCGKDARLPIEQRPFTWVRVE